MKFSFLITPAHLWVCVYFSILFLSACSGSDGKDGLNTLVNISTERVGVNCFNGGSRIDTGIDSDANGTLDPGEISETRFVCNGGDHGPSGWQVAEVIETDNTSNAVQPRVAVADNGNAMAAWIQWDGVRNNVWVNRYTSAAGWQSVELIGPAIGVNIGAGASVPDVAMNTNGDAMVVWRHSDGVRADIWSNRYEAGVGWDGPVRIETDDAGSAFTPEVVMDDNGNAVAVWIQSDGIRPNIWANRYVADIGWGTAELIETDNAGDVWRPQVAIDDSGNVIAVWNQSDGARDNAWANRYVVGTGWGMPELIELDDTGSVLGVKVAVDGSGNAVAVWPQHDGVRANIMANRYVTGTGWGSAELIETDDAGSTSDAQVAVDGSGNAIAVWVQSDGTLSNIWANRYLLGADWGIAELIETYNSGDAIRPQLALDSSGNGVAVWYQHDSYRFNIWANRYVAGWGWGAASVIETDNAGNATETRLGIDGSGNVTAVWHQDDGADLSIWANRYLAPAP